ncbi:MAG: hypothetical protein K0S45_2926 [Nitrospira sp.]|nr:hypothetical protein [Nitrospira sp.]
MNSEVETLNMIRRHVSQAFPNWRIEEGSRTGVDRTLQLFDGVPLQCTIQIGMDLLHDTHHSLSEIETALRNKDLVGLVQSAPVVYINNNTLSLK